MDAYSTLLLSSMIALGGAAAVALVRRDKWPVVLATIVLALALALVSLILHAFTGHGPETPEPMGLVALLRAHPAPVTVILASIAASVVLLRRGVARPRA